MTQLLTENVGWKLFSLAVAVLLWITFAQEAELGAFVSVPIAYKGMPDELEIASDVVSAVSMDVRGSTTAVQRFQASPSALVLDFSGIHKPGDHTFHIGDASARLPSGIRLVRAVPAQLHFQFERRATQEIPVEVRWAAAPEKSYHVTYTRVTPDRLTAVGPESRVRSVKVMTDPIDLSPVIGESEFHVAAYLSDPHVRFQGSARVAVKVRVEKR